MAKSILARIDSFVKHLGVPLFALSLFLLSHTKVISKSTLKSKHLIRALHSNTTVKVVGVVVTSLAVIAIGGYYYIFDGLPSALDLSSRHSSASTKIYDRNGALLYTIYADQNRTPIPISELSADTINAVLAAEDALFYSHPGFSLKGIGRALSLLLSDGSVTGGSTITQQLVKNTLLTSERTLQRKLRELVVSLETERLYTKDEILGMYINEVSFGGTSYGIQEASRTYFGKDAHDLSLTESAFLAGLIESPTRLSPYGSNPSLGIDRAKQVLALMEQNNFIDSATRQNAQQVELVFNKQKTDMKAPHFVMYVRQILEDTYGVEVVARGGLNVVTTLDLGIQQAAQTIVSDQMPGLSRFHATNAASIVVNPKTSEILAMVGSRDYYNIASDGNVNVTLSTRAPGSSIKVVNYAYALSHGFSAASLLSDTPVTFSTPGSPPFSPKNYDGKYIGNITLRNALAQSRNIPAVKVLANIGVAKMIETGKAMGITTWTDPLQYGLSLTLGGGGTRLIDMAHVYATLANAGKNTPLATLISVTDSKGRILYTNQCVVIGACDFKQVIDPGVAFILTDILSDNTARTPTFGSRSLLTIAGHPEVAVKTGTSNDLRDNLAIGYTQDFVVAVWVGNNNNSPMAKVASGVTGATPIWNGIMTHLLQDKPSTPWTPPQGVDKVTICANLGTLPCQGCVTRSEWFIAGSKPTKHCISSPQPSPSIPSIL